MMRRLFERLDTTPGQEKVIAEAFDEAETAGRAARDTFVKARADYAQAMRGEHFDSEVVRAAFEKQQAALEEVKKSLMGGMQKIHEALTPEQRTIAAQLMEFGPRGFGHGHHGHHGGWHGRHHHDEHFSMHRPGAVNL